MSPCTLICGAGTLGSRLAEMLARSGWRNLAVLDFDRVEERNLSNQIYELHQIGLPKVTALADRIHRATGVEVRCFKHRLEEHNQARLLSGYDLLIDCFDNSLARRLVQDWSRRNGQQVLHLGLAADYAEVIWDAHYNVPPDPSLPRDVCQEPVAAHLSLLTVAVALKSLQDFHSSGIPKSWTMTLEDLAIEPWTLTQESVESATRQL